MKLKDYILGGMVIGGGIWFIWVVFLIIKNLYANWFFMSLNPIISGSLWSLDYFFIILIGLGIGTGMGIIGGLLFYGFKRAFHISGESWRRAEAEQREIIKDIINNGTFNPEEVADMD